MFLTFPFDKGGFITLAQMINDMINLFKGKSPLAPLFLSGERRIRK